MLIAAGQLVATAFSDFAASRASIHEQLGRAEFGVRMTLGLAVAGALQSPSFQLSLPSNLGLGTTRQALHSIAQMATGKPAAIALTALNFLHTSLPSRDPALVTIEKLRNHLFHGGAAPAESAPGAIAATLASAIDQFGAALGAELNGVQFAVEQNQANWAPLCLADGATSNPTLPLLAMSSNSGALLVFSRLTKSNIVLGAARPERAVVPRGDLEPTIRRLFRGKGLETLAADYTQAAIEDLEGFQEPGSRVDVVSEAEGVMLDWVHADGSQTTRRRDRLRIGPDNAWQWYDSEGWSGYSVLLRRLANWSTLRNRLANLLSEKIAATQAEENSYVPVPAGLHSTFVPPTVRVSRANSESQELSWTEFIQRLDRELQSNRGTTNLYFLHAEAGAGKTTALMRLAQSRAAEENAPQSSPLYLYVSARGNVLEDLDKAVNATLAETRVLTSAGVRALCRAGLIIPIVDGFDELVGSPTYSDALASLRPWLTALGGRGILVVSARSSYFLTLFEESIRRETNRDIAVWHHIAELARWTPQQRDDYLLRAGISTTRVYQLQKPEQELLRLPFFARASIAELHGASDLTSLDLVGALVAGYLQREFRKIDGHGDKLITVDELDVLFEELALWMMQQSTREASWADFLLVAEVSLNNTASAETKNRLGALCGLDASGIKDRRFRFSHEVFLDFFFGRRVGRQLAEPSRKAALSTLKSTQLRPTSARVANRFRPLTQATLSQLAKSIGSNESPSQSRLATNLGLLWAEMVATTQQLIHSTLTRVAFASSFDVSSVSLTNATFEGCEFARLEIGGGAYRNVRFEKCTIQELRITGACHGVVFSHCLIEMVLGDGVFAERPDEIATAISGVGGVADFPGEALSADKQMTAMARYFLQKMDSRRTLPIVVKADRLPEEDLRLSWISRNAELWQRFVKALEVHGLAQLESITAGGAPKFRLRMELPPNQLLESEGSPSRVREFWKTLAHDS